jgi:hypothetical protein
MLVATGMQERHDAREVHQRLSSEQHHGLNVLHCEGERAVR